MFFKKVWNIVKGDAKVVGKGAGALIKVAAPAMGNILMGGLETGLNIAESSVTSSPDQDHSQENYTRKKPEKKADFTFDVIKVFIKKYWMPIAGVISVGFLLFRKGNSTPKWKK